MSLKRAIVRALVSLVGGTALFLGVAVGGGVLSTYTEDYSTKVLLAMPVRWPRYVYYYLSPASAKPSLVFDDTASLVTLIACDVALYSLLVFFALWMLPLFRRRKPSFDAPPPPDLGGV